MTINGFIEQLDFEPDKFQLDAMETIMSGQSVVVSAPTGSGKTLIAEFAAHQAIETGKRIFYTTPLKALSNQKFYDFRRLYGEENVGILTGDTSINREARIIVMTTEIFRNMLYGIHTDPEYLNTVGYVVLDECHYMNDAQRGTVWEETIIYCPEHIQVIALSATVANADELTEWINDVHHDTRLIESDFRPVPLRFSFYDRNQLSPLVDNQGKMNKQLKGHRKGNRLPRHQRRFDPNDLIELMAEKDMLPAIFFTFSRKDCDMHQKNTRALRLLNGMERELLRRRIDDFVANQPYLKDHPSLRGLANGFASHHAGLLPGLKHLVEKLFQEGLIKVVFATETLAAGINMPARSTVITKISKRCDDGHRILHANEFHQMAGRAGRRGMDERGYVVVVSSQYEGAREAATLVASKSDPLNSQFTPTYGMVLNLLKTRDMEEAEYVISRSFGQFTSARRLKPLIDTLKRKEDQLEEVENFECPEDISDKEFSGYLKSRLMLFDTNRFINTLKKQIKKHGPSPEIIQQLQKEEAKKANIQQSLDALPCRNCDLLKKHEKLSDRHKRLKKQVTREREYLEDQRDIYWQSFCNIYHLLKHVGYIDDNDEPTEQGMITAQLRVENEYFTSEIIFKDLLLGLPPEALAAVVCAMVCDNNKDRMFAKLHPSPMADEAIRLIEGLGKNVYKTQRKFYIEVPVIINPLASGLIEAWAQGADWGRITSMTNMGEGDLVRLFRRTSDLLRQLSRVPGIPKSVQEAAKTARKMVDREPIKEIESIVADLEEEAEEEVRNTSEEN